MKKSGLMKHEKIIYIGRPEPLTGDLQISHYDFDHEVQTEPFQTCLWLCHRYQSTAESISDTVIIKKFK